MRCAALVICYKYEEFLHGEEAILPLGGNSAHCGGIPGLLSFLKVIFFFLFRNTAALAEMGGVELQNRSQCLAADTRCVLS